MRQIRARLLLSTKTLDRWVGGKGFTAVADNDIQAQGEARPQMQLRLACGPLRKASVGDQADAQPAPGGKYFRGRSISSPCGTEGDDARQFRLGRVMGAN